MLRALAESRERQARLVTDAGHELRTPLTSLRTNVELLMASMATGSAAAARAGDGRSARRCARADRGIVHAGRRFGGPHPGRCRSGGARAGRHVRRRRSQPGAGQAAPQRHSLRRRGRSRGRCTATPPDCRARCSTCWTTRPSGARRAATSASGCAQLDPPHAELVVSDHGPGIPPQERRLVFERFYRSTSARAMPGSGLGLAIVKQVVLNHGGLLRVEDTVPGGQPPGTSIYVLLPGRPIAGVGVSGGRRRRRRGSHAPVNDRIRVGDAENSREPYERYLSGFSVRARQGSSAATVEIEPQSMPDIRPK